MNIIAGWIRPEMNWARKLEAYSASLCSAKVCVASSCRPNTLTSECPVYISSMCPLSRPVVAHCLTNCGCARLPILAAAQIETGTVTSAISASSGEITNIIVSTPTMVSSEVTSWLSVCCSDWADVVDVVGDPAEQLAARLPVEVAQRQPGQLGLDLLAQPEDDALHDRRRHPALRQHAG